MTADEWVRRFEEAFAREANEEVDFTALGEELGKDRTLSQAQYEEVLRRIAGKLFSPTFSTVLDYCLGHRGFPSEEFWIDVILSARDWDVGGKILDALLPFVDLTGFVCKLLPKVRDLPEKEHRRISFVVWAATCSGSINIPAGDRFLMKEAVQPEALALEIKKWRPYFKQAYDRDSLERALRSLGE